MRTTMLLLVLVVVVNEVNEVDVVEEEEEDEEVVDVVVKAKTKIRMEVSMMRHHLLLQHLHQRS